MNARALAVSADSIQSELWWSAAGFDGIKSEVDTRRWRQELGGKMMAIYGGKHDGSRTIKISVDLRAKVEKQILSALANLYW